MNVVGSCSGVSAFIVSHFQKMGVRLMFNLIYFWSVYLCNWEEVVMSLRKWYNKMNFVQCFCDLIRIKQLFIA